MSEANETVDEAQPETLMSTLGIRVVERTPERVIVELPFSRRVAQPMGLFHAGAIFALADSAATNLLLYALNGDAAATPDTFPLGIQLNGNIIRARGEGTLRAEAVPLHIGRSTAVVETKVRDEDGKLIAAVTTTHFVPASRG